MQYLLILLDPVLVLMAGVALKGTSRGISTSPAQKAKILEAVASLEGAGKGTVTTSGQDVDGTWKLLWTTEKVGSAPICGHGSN